RLYRVVGADLLVDDALDLGYLLVRDRLVVREVEAQPAWLDHRAGLVHVGAQYVAQGFVQQVGGRVVAHGVPADAGRHLGAHLGPGPEGALHDHATVHDDAPDGPAGVAHLHQPALPVQRALVAYLPAAVGVEGR